MVHPELEGCYWYTYMFGYQHTVGKGLGKAVQDVYPDVEHRECMRHLWKNFKKHYSSDLFNYNMCPTAKACTIEKFNWHMGKI